LAERQVLILISQTTIKGDPPPVSQFSGDASGVAFIAEHLLQS